MLNPQALQLRVGVDVAPQRFKRHTGFKICREPASDRHFVFLRQLVEYTLTPCPISWDHLSSQ